MPQPPRFSQLLPEHRTLSVSRYVPRHCDTHAQVPRVHDHGILSYQQTGRQVMWMGASYRLEAGDALIIPSGAPHRILETEQSESWGMAICTRCYAAVCGGLLTQIFSEVAQGACAVRRVPPERREWVELLFARMAEETEQPQVYQEHAIQGLLGLLVAEVARAKHTTPSEQPPLHPLVAETLQYIEQYALQPISLADVAAAMKRNTAYLTTLIKQHTGWTVVEWLTQIRMNEARRRLLHSDEFIEIIAERIGYTSPSHFHSLFRRLHKSTPAAWRRNHQHNTQSKELPTKTHDANSHL